MRQLAGRLVLITGAAGGLGRLLALEFARAGSRLVLWDISEAGLLETRQLALEAAAAAGGAANTVAPAVAVTTTTAATTTDSTAATTETATATTTADAAAAALVTVMTVDLSQREAIYAAAARTKEECGRVEVLVNNAGIVSGRPFLQLTDDQIERTMAVNAMAHMWLAKAFLPPMIAANVGHIVTIASAAGVIGVNGLADYCASKAAAVGFDESIRLELKRLGVAGVKTTCVCPYYIATGMFAGVQTRFPLLLPIMQPEAVVRRIMAAVRGDRAYLYLPPVVGWVGLFRSVLPTAVFDWAMAFLGITRSMDHFVGRIAGPAGS